MSQLCDQCTKELKDEVNFIIHVLNTPHLSDYNVELANEVLYGSLRELYQVKDCEDEGFSAGSSYTAGDGVYTVTSTSGQVVNDLANLIKK